MDMTTSFLFGWVQYALLLSKTRSVLIPSKLVTAGIIHMLSTVHY